MLPHLPTILLALTALVSAADICRTTGSGCSGSKVCCTGIQENNCCNLGASKTQVLFSLPANSRGQGWSQAGCTGASGTFKNANKVTDRCVSFSWGVSSAKWLTGGGTKRSAEFEEDVNKSDGDTTTEACAEPDTAYYDLDGEQHEVVVPEGQADYVMNLIEEGEWDKLNELKSAKSG